MRTEKLHRLNFRHLYYFWTVAREEHLTRAAEQLHVSQSAVSSQLRKLEAELGHELFTREGRSLRLTEAGALVLGYADSIFNLGAELLETVRDGQDSPELRVGSVATLSRNFQENLLRPVIGDASLRLLLESASLEELLERLRVHRLDLVLSNRPVSSSERVPLHCRRIARQSVCLVGPVLAARKRFRFPEDLADQALLLPGHNSDIRTQFDLLCDRLAIAPRIAAEVDDMAMLRLLTRDSGMLALVPEVVVQDELAAGVLQKLCELPDIFENFYAITARRHFQPAALRAILQAN
jgi:LysR family transcriptional activator of nhaA